MWNMGVNVTSLIGACIIFGIVVGFLFGVILGAIVW